MSGLTRLGSIFVTVMGGQAVDVPLSTMRKICDHLGALTPQRYVMAVEHRGGFRVRLMGEPVEGFDRGVSGG